MSKNAKPLPVRGGVGVGQSSTATSLRGTSPPPTQCRVKDAPHPSGDAGGMADPTLLKGRGL